MAVTGLPFYADSAIGVIVVVLVLVIGALTLLPALLVILGDRLDRLKLPDMRNRNADNGTRWERWARAVMKRPVPVLIIGTLILLAAAIPVIGVRTGTDLNARAMKGEPAADALAVVERAFPAASLTPVEVLVTSAEAPVADGTRAALGVLSRHEQLGPADQTPLGPDAMLLVATPTVAADSLEADTLVRELRSQLAQAMPPGFHAQVTGVTAELVDYTAETNRWTPFVVIFTLGLSFLVLLWVFRSPLLAAKAIVLNLLTVGAAFGLTVLVFQEGLGEKVLGFTSLGFVQGWMPITLFLVMFGLAMDYEVFIVTRIREEYERTGNTVDAIALGLGRTGVVVTSAAAIMVAILGSFCLNRIPEMKQMGFGLAVAVLLDATLVRATLVPAFMKIAGRWNWWIPRRLDRLLPEFQHG
jgi:RND superfamily putative drug exporter